ncbi:MAG: serine hydrolase [Bacteroidales bacterium]|jgi:CubicO group peptidase (beta-lactamase class C family)|nr:serine hydrolase [Bacteroidales bacterium]
MKNIVKFIVPLLLVIAVPIILFIQKEESEIQKIDRVTQKVYDQFNPTGLSVAIVQHGEIIYDKALGYKNAEKISFLERNDIFNIASCTKAFTAAAIGKLVQEGLLSWDDKVIDYYPDFKLKDDCISQNLTLKDILTHRSGLGTFYGDLLWYHSDYTNEEILQRMQYLPLKKQFRTEYGYQNNMYTLAGEIIEKVTGQSWENFIKQNFLIPLEMNSTRTSSDDFDGTESLAFPHYKDSVFNPYYFAGGKPAASIWSNPRDLTHWLTMFLNNGQWNGTQILSPEIIYELTSPETILPVSDERKSFGIHFRAYAPGWVTYDYSGYKILEHSGSMPGYSSKVAFIPEKNTGIVILNNGFNFFSNNALLFSYLDIILEKEINNWTEYYLQEQRDFSDAAKKQNADRIAQRKANTKPSFELKKYTGTYEDIMYGKAEITLDNELLSVTFLPSSKFLHSKMEHWHDNSFKVNFKDVYLPFGIINFKVDTLSNQVDGFRIDLPSHDFHFHNLDFKKLK